MNIDRKQLISAIIALCVLIGCAALLITKGFVFRFALLGGAGAGLGVHQRMGRFSRRLAFVISARIMFT